MRPSSDGSLQQSEAAIPAESKQENLASEGPPKSGDGKSVPAADASSDSPSNGSGVASSVGDQERVVAFRDLFFGSDQEGKLEDLFVAEADPIATAHHEAAHAVLAVRLGLDLVEVTAKPTAGRSFGHTNIEVPVRESRGVTTGGWKELKAVTMLAGGVAEVEFRKKIFLAGIRSDFFHALVALQAAQEAGKSADLSADEYLQRIVAVARDRVRRNWTPITRLAEKLAAVDSLSGEDARRIISPWMMLPG